MVLRKMEHGETVVVIGAGVTGLTIALRLQELGHCVLIAAVDFPGPSETLDPETQINYASPWAGAHNGWGRDLPDTNATKEDWRDHAFALKTFARMKDLHSKHKESGINFIRGFEYFEDPPEKAKNLTAARASEIGIEDFEIIPKEQLPENVALGYSFSTWSINPMVYCSFLLRKFSLQRGRIIKTRLQSPQEAFELPTVHNVRCVINASGTGFGDPSSYIVRGQTCVVANDCDVSISRHFADGTVAFCIPRKFDGGTIIGGTAEPDNWSRTPSESVRNHFLKTLAATYPDILGESGKYQIQTDIVGRRPYHKGGMRLETESVDDQRTIVHAYGAGGRGYELSWGVADYVSSIISSANQHDAI